MPQARPAASTVTGGLARARRHRGAILRLTVELAVVGLAILLLTRQRASLAGLGEQLGHLRWGWLTVAVGAEAASVVALAALQNWLLGIGGVRPSLWSMVRITLASNAIALSLPAGVALSEGYAFQQYRRKGADGSLAAWAELPITPGGVGIVEGGLVLTLVAYGGSPVSSTAAVLVYRSISFWLLILVGWLAWALRYRRSTAR
jgi:uncharacterized membrane protein YbhN (UPF0104 family)